MCDLDQQGFFNQKGARSVLVTMMAWIRIYAAGELVGTKRIHMTSPNVVPLVGRVARCAAVAPVATPGCQIITAEMVAARRAGRHLQDTFLAIVKTCERALELAAMELQTRTGELTALQEAMLKLDDERQRTRKVIAMLQTMQSKTTRFVRCSSPVR